MRSAMAAPARGFAEVVIEAIRSQKMSSAGVMFLAPTCLDRSRTVRKRLDAAGVHPPKRFLTDQLDSHER